MNAALLALLTSVALAALAPGVAANHAGTPEEYLVSDVCLYETIHPDYAECYGVYHECEGGNGQIGVGHVYEYTGSSQSPPYGQEGGWCYAYVAYDTSPLRADVCTDLEGNTHVCVGADGVIAVVLELQDQIGDIQDQIQ